MGGFHNTRDRHRRTERPRPPTKAVSRKFGTTGTITHLAVPLAGRLQSSFSKQKTLLSIPIHQVSFDSSLSEKGETFFCCFCCSSSLNEAFTISSIRFVLLLLHNHVLFCFFLFCFRGGKSGEYGFAIFLKLCFCSR